ncbi:hypothetical protein WN943_029293 [Citrus x changshan-huyou]
MSEVLVWCMGEEVGKLWRRRLLGARFAISRKSHRAKINKMAVVSVQGRHSWTFLGVPKLSVQWCLDLQSDRRSAVSMDVKTKKKISCTVQWNPMASSKINFADIYSFLNDESRLVACRTVAPRVSYNESFPWCDFGVTRTAVARKGRFGDWCWIQMDYTIFDRSSLLLFAVAGDDSRVQGCVRFDKGGE